MAKLKTNFDKILETLEAKPVDMKKVYEDRKKQIESAQKKWDAEYKKEQKRIENLFCPCCKSKEKSHVLKSTSNGVFGPGYHSTVTDDYYVCMNCGAHYSDIKKKDLGKRPYDSLFR
jgi:transposase-like protein